MTDKRFNLFFCVTLVFSLLWAIALIALAVAGAYWLWSHS